MHPVCRRRRIDFRYLFARPRRRPPTPRGRTGTTHSAADDGPYERDHRDVRFFVFFCVSHGHRSIRHPCPTPQIGVVVRRTWRSRRVCRRPRAPRRWRTSAKPSVTTSTKRISANASRSSWRPTAPGKFRDERHVTRGEDTASLYFIFFFFTQSPEWFDVRMRCSVLRPCCVDIIAIGNNYRAKGFISLTPIDFHFSTCKRKTTCLWNL